MSEFLGIPYVNPCNIELLREEQILTSLGGGKIGIRFGTGRWAVQIALAPDIFSRAKYRLAAHRAKHGSLSSFLLLMPQIEIAELPNGIYRIGANAAIGVDSVMLRCNQNLTLSVGRFIKFSNHNKVYQVNGETDYAITDVAQAVSIVPNLVTGVKLSGVNRWDAEPSLTCRYSENSRGFIRVDRRSVVTRSISVEEV